MGMKSKVSTVVISEAEITGEMYDCKHTGYLLTGC